MTNRENKQNKKKRKEKKREKRKKKINNKGKAYVTCDVNQR